MKWSEIRRIAEDNGWYLFSRGANHDIYRHNGRSDIVVISRHGSEEIKTGTYNKLKKQIETEDLTYIFCGVSGKTMFPSFGICSFRYARLLYTSSTNPNSRNTAWITSFQCWKASLPKSTSSTAQNIRLCSWLRSTEISKISNKTPLPKGRGNYFILFQKGGI